MSAPEEQVCGQCGQSHPLDRACDRTVIHAPVVAEIIPFRPRPPVTNTLFTPDDLDGPSAA
ncbi:MULTISPECIES: hypothetical protein [unclassified Brevundimonas]|uniref:hypothetical protein n=1 Tax=unclassified Brevundimonas TaxID=2622653 RepID=UPI0025BC6BF1|nr:MULTISPECIES: hypothetical protein [unclassified Brevundimonas]